MSVLPLPRKEDGTTVFSLDRIQEGERIRAERHEKAIAEGRLVDNSIAGIFARPQPATDKQVSYATDLALNVRLMAAPDMSNDTVSTLEASLRKHFAGMDRETISLRISELRGEL